MRPSGVYLSTASGRSLESLLSSSSRDRPVCCTRALSTSGPIACSSCGGAICLFCPELTQDWAASPWPFRVKLLTRSWRPPLSVLARLGPPAAAAPPCCCAPATRADWPLSISASLSLFWYPATAISPNRAVMDGNPWLILGSSTASVRTVGTRSRDHMVTTGVRLHLTLWDSESVRRQAFRTYYGAEARAGRGIELEV